MILSAAASGKNNSSNCGQSGINKVKADVNETVKDGNGPTIKIGYSEEDIKKNPVPSFMYFVPLIAPVNVERATSADNNEMGWIISYKKENGSTTFYAACEFKMQGKGYHIITFDANGMIARNTKNLEEGEPLSNILDYIRFEGDGTGLFEARGTITDSNATVTDVTVIFNHGNEKSPVSVGLYSIKPVDGKYEYANRCNELVARVNTLEFKRSEGDPRMAIEVASVRKKTEDECLMSNIKGLIANFFIKPLEVDKRGNDAMLNFGYAIYKKTPVFTFPQAMNIQKEVTLN